MSLLSTDPIARVVNETRNLIKPGVWCEGSFQFGANPTVALNDFIDFFDAGIFQGFEIADWYVETEQLDTGGTPTLAVNVGFGDGSGVSGTAGYRFAQAKLFGGAAGTLMLRNDSFFCRLQRAPNLRLGVSIAALPAVAAFANKRLRFGVLPMPVLF